MDMSILFFIVSGALFALAAFGVFAIWVDEVEIDEGPLTNLFIASGIFAIAGVLA